MIDYETTSQFDLVITATDLVVPESGRRQVSEMYVSTYNVSCVWQLYMWLCNFGLDWTLLTSFSPNRTPHTWLYQS